MDTPWSRIKEYMNLLGSLKNHTPMDHPDQTNITNTLNKLREFYLYLKQIQERIEKRYRLIHVQKTILNCPVIYNLFCYSKYNLIQ